MSPEAQELDAYFQEGPAPMPQELNPPDESERQEFEEFFRKLSTLDDLSWKEPAPAARPADPPATPAAPATGAAARPEAGTAEPTPAQATPGKPTPAAKAAGRIRIPANERRATEFEPASPNASPSPFGDMKPLAHRNRARLWIAAAKMTGVGVLLFAMGLAGGWLVLSLPKRLERHHAPRPTVAQETAVSPRASGSAVAPHATPAVAPVPPPPAPPVELVAPTGAGLPADGALASAPPVVERPAALQTRLGEAAPQPVVETVTMTPAKAKAHPARTPAAKPALASAPKVAAPVAGNPRYALQVGACGSTACVDRYRALLDGHVAAGTIQVAARPQAAGADLQRIRIAPLDREAALKLKERLAAVDPRFGAAYLVAL